MRIMYLFNLWKSDLLILYIIPWSLYSSTFKYISIVEGVYAIFFSLVELLKIGNNICDKLIILIKRVSHQPHISSKLHISSPLLTHISLSPNAKSLSLWPILSAPITLNPSVSSSSHFPLKLKPSLLVVWLPSYPK